MMLQQINHSRRLPQEATCSSTSGRLNPAVPHSQVILAPQPVVYLSPRPSPPSPLWMSELTGASWHNTTACDQIPATWICLYSTMHVGGLHDQHLNRALKSPKTASCSWAALSIMQSQAQTKRARA